MHEPPVRLGLPAGGADRLRTILIALCVLLVLLSAAMYVLRLGFDHDRVFGLSRLLDVDRERNVPTWVASASLLVSGLLFAMIGFDKLRARIPLARLWFVPAVFYAALSLDEIASIHEMMRLIPASGAFAVFSPYSWAIWGLAFVLVVAFFAVRIAGRLPAVTRRRLYVAWAIYFGGATVFELIGGFYAMGFGKNDAWYATIVHLEEFGELLGSALLIHALYAYWGDFVARARAEASGPEALP